MTFEIALYEEEKGITIMGYIRLMYSSVSDTEWGLSVLLKDSSAGRMDGATETRR